MNEPTCLGLGQTWMASSSTNEAIFFPPLPPLPSSTQTQDSTFFYLALVLFACRNNKRSLTLKCNFPRRDNNHLTNMLFNHLILILLPCTNSLKRINALIDILMVCIIKELECFWIANEKQMFSSLNDFIFMVKTSIFLFTVRRT